MMEVRQTWSSRNYSPDQYDDFLACIPPWVLRMFVYDISNDDDDTSFMCLLHQTTATHVFSSLKVER